MAETASKTPPKDIGTILQELHATPEGLSSQEAEKRLDQYGINALEEKEVNPLLKILSYFWGPIPWMIEAAAVLSAVVAHWADLIIILILLVINAGIGLFEEHKAENALAALKNKLALKARALRDGKWGPVEAKNLVPGDVIRLRLGDVIPADAACLEGEYLSVDQAALTGESLPVSKKKGDTVYSGSVAKQGEMVAVVTATGNNTFFGKTAKLVAAAGGASHFQKAVMTIGNYLIYMTLALVAVLILVGLDRGESPLELVQFSLILTVAAIPVAMPAVLSVTMAVGALALSRMKAIVSKLEAIEEMAGMDILCSDKTGTLTQNKLTLGDTVLFAAKDNAELILTGALASKAEDQDAIDLAILGGLDDPKTMDAYKQTSFTPFDPVSKRTEAAIEEDSGKKATVTKGAPQVIINLCKLDGDDKERALKAVNDFASTGYRTLGVARREGDGPWTFLGILSLFDPPREDSAETIKKAGEHGIAVKMVTGDNAAIGREISRQLGLGTEIVPAEKFFTDTDDVSHLGETVEERIEAADGFAEVFPEHKYGIVKALQDRGHLVGMTGDGVNDAPALKQADVGVAVSGATDAARAAADLVLTAPGLSVIVDAVEYARRIFERMNSYAIYRITETIRIMLFVVLAILVYNFYPITAIMIILLALLNDLPIMSIAYDNTYLDPNPVRWNMKRVMTLAIVLGVTGVIGSFGLLILAKSYLHLDIAQIQSFVFLKLAVAGHLTLFVTRTRKPFWSPPYPAPIMLWSAIVTKVLATLFVGMGWFVAKLAWSDIGIIWTYCVIWLFVADRAKLMVYRHLSTPENQPRHRRTLDRLNRVLHPNA
ncbi:plasma-membrane proton-efflux P-type ATPase [Oceanidesulfovibrio marinus]|uniref:Plasma-membrane proton-efflux P-type ATPase n=1 Tax=Oceanidesulfovibrio marinus TaxID=370038 RepID=A0ABX6NEG7_9BACT|nr:plasma-membrane proton-efflux P-type ATPase [Oceanidesulfovibrio marinus]QJT08987.1 plasma-membrane proton-efflux P-type ATPase [Oceanidesulfovibrio marinus]